MANEITTEERKEKLLQAAKLFRDGQKLLAEAGLRLMFDSYNDDGLYVVPEAVDFPDYSEDSDNADAAEFLGKCPKIIEVDGLYNDGGRQAADIPEWWEENFPEDVIPEE